MRQAALIAVLLASWFSVTLAASKSYDVVPYGNCVSEIVTSPNNGIAQYYRNTLDSLTRVSWWCGDTFSGGVFDVVVTDSAVPTYQIAHGPNGGQHAPKCWAWLDFRLTEVSQPVRGRTYKVTITNQITQNGGPISFAYDPNNPYRFGHMSVSGANPQPDTLASDFAAMVAA